MKDESMRETAAKYLGELNDISAVPALIACQSDKSKSVEKASTRSLEKLAYHKNKKNLIKNLK